MPHHIHILTAPSEEDRAISLPRFIQRFKSTSTRRLWKVGISGSVWQRSFYDHILRQDEDLEPAAKYILANPVRKGLVQTAEAYPLSQYFPENVPS